MTLFFIGLGLGNEKDITVRGLETVKKCDFLYLESYTSILIDSSREKLEEFYGKKIIEADRDLVETKTEETILFNAKTKNVGFLVIGDPFGATTHSDLLLRAHTMGIKTDVIHNSSILNSIGVCGIQLYNVGQVVSLVFFTENWRPDSFYDKIQKNMSIGVHTLCLLDIKMKERSIENIMLEKDIFEPPRFMNIKLAIDQLMEIEEKRKEGVYSWDTLCVGLARIGSKTQKIVSGRMREVREVDFGKPLHSFIICCEKAMHPLEREHVGIYNPFSKKKK